MSDSLSTQRPCIDSLLPSLCQTLLFSLWSIFYWLIPKGLRASLSGSVGRESACNAEDPGSIPGSGRFPWRRKWQPTPIFLSGKSHGQRSLVDYSAWGCKESDTTEWMNHHQQPLWASRVAQIVKNLPAVRETWVHSLSWEDPLEEGMAAHSSILAWRIPMDRGAWQAPVHGVTESDTTDHLSTQSSETFFSFPSKYSL